MSAPTGRRFFNGLKRLFSLKHQLVSLYHNLPVGAQETPLPGRRLDTEDQRAGAYLVIKTWSREGS
jgi:hypothetical protein